LEIDDRWESRYGDLMFDSGKFPDPKAMIEELHRMGFRVTLWVHPFVNADSRTYRSTEVQPWLLADKSGRPGLIKWWNGIAAVWDFTNPRASDEFRGRLKNLESLGVDGFKFDGGDVNFVPRDMRPHQPITPAQYADVYNREAAAKWAWAETRVGVYSQPLGVVQRLIDKHSVWGLENGLAATVPEAITVSLRGFPYVMPNMVGGNQYDSDKIDKKLLVRWAQASALMPLLQFSWGPWHFDEETVRLCREASNLHIAFAPYIIRLARAVPTTGEPIVRPLWYNTPEDPETHAISDQFMLGADVVVAPVLERGARARRLYLPRGQWIEWRTKQAVTGGRWLDAHPAPLEILPVFVRAGFRIDDERG
ncbi:MAG TPA: glycoside hydrolase family 31 protein, partial [Bryobacteraceae bacterium]|nr:glycoside hydrolase family 31 protein [Bryobacteraceae bacterium]